MAKITLSDILGQYASVTELNDNFNKIETAIENTVSRDGTAPNTMEAALDMNSQRVTNLPAPAANTDALRLIDIPTESVGSTSALFVTITDSADNYASTNVEATLAEIRDTSIFVIGTYTDMLSSIYLNIGNIVQTTGYTAIHDSGDALYEIVAAGTGVAADGYFDLSGSSLQARYLLQNNLINTRQFGNTTDDIPSLRLTPGLVDSYTFLPQLTTPGDGGSYWYWDTTSTATDNGTTVVKVTAVTTGRWLKVLTRSSALYNPELSSKVIDVTSNTTAQVGVNTSGVGNDFDLISIEEDGVFNLWATQSAYLGSSVVKMISMEPIGNVRLYVDNGGGGTSEAARTVSPASGGFKINNTLTGTGFERALTESDLSVNIFGQVTNTGVTNPTFVGSGVSSVLRTAIGSYTLTLSNTLPDTNGAVFATPRVNGQMSGWLASTTTVTIKNYDDSGNLADVNFNIQVVV